jgi:hypothetical protein
MVSGRGEAVAAKADLRGDDINETRLWTGTRLPDFQLLEFHIETHRLNPSVGFIVFHMASLLILSEISSTIG